MPRTQEVPVSWTWRLTRALESTKYDDATSAPLADDGFRQRLALNGDGLIVRVVVVDVLGGIGKAGDEAARHHLAVDFLDGERLVPGLGGLGALRLCGGRRRIARHGLPEPGEGVANHVGLAGVKPGAHRIMDEALQVFR